MKPIKNIFSAFGHFISTKLDGRQGDKQLLSGLDINLDHLYEDPSIATEVQSRFTENIRRMDTIRPNYKKYVNYVAVLERLEMLPSKVKKELEKLAQVYSETLVQKTEFRDKIKDTDTNKAEYLERYDGQMDEIVKMMQEHEENQRLVKQDLAYLESEKSDLSYYAERYGRAYRWVRSGFVVAAVVAAASAFVLSTMFFVYKMAILMPAMIAMVAVITATVWVYVFRRYLIHEIKKNQKLMQRAVTLINKTKIKYINNQKVLDYQYQKYRVDSSEMLVLRWENYKAKLAARNQYRNISNTIAAMITDVEKLLVDHHVEDDGLVLDHIDYFVSKSGRQILMKKLVERKSDLKEEYDRLEKENTVINLILTNYKSHKVDKKEV